MSVNPRPLVRKETMQEAIIYFLTEIHPTLQHPYFVKFRNAIWERKSWFFENPVVVRWMLNHMRSYWSGFETEGFQEGILAFFYYHVGVVAGGPYREEDLQVLTNPSLTDVQQQAKYQAWNVLLNHRMMIFPGYTDIAQLVPEMHWVNDGLEGTIRAFYRNPERTAMFYRAARRPGNGFLALPRENLQRIMDFYITIDIPQTGGPNPQEVRDYIMGLPVWNEF
jgi:hypothetical protein